jgi:flavin-dependent dehydrogenase
MRVLLLEGQKLHTDQPISTHAIQTHGMDLLDDLGLGNRVRAVATAIHRTRLDVNGHAVDIPMRPGRAMYCLRRSTLDPILQDAARDSGVDLRDETHVTNLLRDGERVTGVEAVHHGKVHRFRARWVVGADGRHSTIARLVGARDYIKHEGERGGYWGYWRKPACWDDDEPWRNFQTVVSLEETSRFCFECDDNLLVIGAIPSIAEARSWGKRYPQELRKSLLASPLFGPLVADAEPIGKLVGMLKLDMFFREPCGPGWALVGDAGLHKDPTPGHGITDALRDAAKLARALVDGRPEAMEVFWRERDVASVPLYFQALDMGRLSFPNPLSELVMDKLAAAGALQVERMQAVFERERPPFEMVAPTTMLRWLASALLRGRFEMLGPFVRIGRDNLAMQRELAHRVELLDAARQRLGRAGAQVSQERRLVA